MLEYKLHHYGIENLIFLTLLAAQQKFFFFFTAKTLAKSIVFLGVDRVNAIELFYGELGTTRRQKTLIRRRLRWSAGTGCLLRRVCLDRRRKVLKNTQCHFHFGRACSAKAPFVRLCRIVVVLSPTASSHSLFLSLSPHQLSASAFCPHSFAHSWVCNVSSHGRHDVDAGRWYVAKIVGSDQVFSPISVVAPV